MFPIKEMINENASLRPSSYIVFLSSLPPSHLWEVLLTNTHTTWTRELVRVWAHYHLCSQLLTKTKHSMISCVFSSQLLRVYKKVYFHTKGIRCSLSVTLSSPSYIHRGRSTDWRRGAYILSEDWCSTHSTQLKILKFRLCESAFEAIGDHYNHAKLECNSGNSSHGRFSNLLPSGISLCVWSTATELSLGSCRFEHSMFTGHKAVIDIEMCTAP